MFTDTSSENNMFKRYIKIIADSKDVFSRRTSEIVKYDRCHRVLVRYGSAGNYSYDTLYVKDVAGVRRRQVKFCGKENIMFHLEQKNSLQRVACPPSITRDYILQCCKEVKKKAKRSHDRGNVWIEKDDGNVGLFVGFV